MKDTSKMAFPMLATGKVSVAGAEYAPGEVFDALTERSQRSLLKANAARPFRLGEHVGRSIAKDADGASKQTEAMNALTPRQLLERFITVEGSNEQRNRHGNRVFRQ